MEKISFRYSGCKQKHEITSWIIHKQNLRKCALCEQFFTVDVTIQYYKIAGSFNYKRRTLRWKNISLDIYVKYLQAVVQRYIKWTIWNLSYSYRKRVNALGVTTRWLSSGETANAWKWSSNSSVNIVLQTKMTSSLALKKMLDTAKLRKHWVVATADTNCCLPNTSHYW